MCVCVSWLTLVHNDQTWISYPHLLSLVARWLCWCWHQDHSVSFTFWVRTPKWVNLNYLHWQGSVFLPYYWFKPLPQGAKLSVDELDLVLWSFDLPYLQYCCTCSFPSVLNAWNIYTVTPRGQVHLSCKSTQNTTEWFFKPKEEEKKWYSKIVELLGTQ